MIFKDSFQNFSEIPFSIPVDELKGIRHKIKQNRSQWVHITKYPMYLEAAAYTTPMYYLGSPVYPCAGNKKLYKLQQELTEPTLDDIAGELQPKVLAAVSEYFKLPIEHLSGASKPGFHIFNSFEKEKDLVIPTFHVDVDILQLFPNVHKADIFSFVFVVEISANGDRLECPNEYFEYTENKLYIWSANMPHKIGDVHLVSDDDYRITYQGHCIKLEDKLLYYW
jgi:hypothetical protein